MAGPPEVYLPLANPRRDRGFMRAVREQRVLSLKQEPTGTRKDFGTVGFIGARHMSYLVFPKPLTAFAGKRIVGIKYDTLPRVALATPRASAFPPRRSIKPTTPKPKPRPRPRHFSAAVRITTVNDVEVTVRARDENTARSKIRQAAQRKLRMPASRVEVELLSLKED